MRKLTLSRTDGITFEEGCNKYLDNCRQRNLRAGTLGHYRQTYTQLFKHLDPGMPVSHCHQSMYNKYVRHLQSILNNEVIFYATDTGYAPMVGMTVAVAVAIEEASG